MIASIRRTLAVYLFWSAAQGANCFIDIDAEIGHSNEKTDVAEPIPSNTMFRTRIPGQTDQTSQRTDVAERIKKHLLIRTSRGRFHYNANPSDIAERSQNNPMVRTKPVGLNSQTSKRPDVAERIGNDPTVQRRPVEADSYTDKRPDVAERLGNDPIVRESHKLTSGYSSQQPDVSERIGFNPVVNDRVKPNRPPVYSPKYKPVIHMGKVHSSRHLARKNRRKNNENDFTRSRSGVAERYIYNPLFERQRNLPFIPPVYKFDFRLIFPGIGKGNNRKYFSE